MSKIALFLNHDRIGGAERSAIEQVISLDTEEIDIFVPGELQEVLKLYSKKEAVKKYRIPRALKHLSRTGKTSYVLAVTSYLLSLFHILKIPVKRYDKIWLNGMKAFVTILPVLILKRYSHPVYFHIRDYLPSSRILSLLMKLSIFRGIELSFITNSFSVRDELLATFDCIEKNRVFVCYNVCEVFEAKPVVSSIKKIGLSSMLTPWKGIHSVLIFSKIFEKELREIGIEGIFIFGDNIYDTLGDSRTYPKELLELKEKLQIDLVSFEGRKKPQEIYSQIDLLIHSSLKAEPFGRIIMEAYGNKIPVLSTGLGGSFELLINQRTQLFQKYHYTDLFEKIKALTVDKEARDKLVADQYSHFCNINDQAKNSIRKALC